MRRLITMLLLLPLAWQDGRGEELWEHLDGTDGLGLRGLVARWEQSSDGARVLELRAVRGGVKPERGVRWVSLPAPASGWALEEAGRIEADLHHTGAREAKVTLWVVGANGWGAVGKEVALGPGDGTTLACELRATYPDGSPKLDPTLLREVRVMVYGDLDGTLKVSGLRAAGHAERWRRPAGRLDVPEMTDGPPAPGGRVRHVIEGERETGVYSALYLPADWVPGRRYPVVAEFPGNLFFKAGTCWSTGRPEDCVMGYGISRGEGAIWVSLPFVDRPGGSVAEFGFGSRSGLDTVAHTRAVLEEICRDWGGDPENLFLCGFSRGAIACGYIGLRDDAIAGLWKGFVACQHYDGSWGTTLDGAVERAPRFRGRAIFQVDNEEAKYRRLVEATRPGVRWRWAESGLGYHSPAMFLDDRPATREVRKWFGELTDGDR